MDRLSDYDYDLPEGLIAQRPLEDRSASRLLLLPRKGGPVEHRRFTDVPGLLREGDLLVLNDTRVSALRLMGRKPTGAEVEALLLSEIEPGRFTALMRPGKRLRTGARVQFEDLSATVEAELPYGQREIRFDDHTSLSERLRQIGTVPLPPYIREALADAERYQTVVAKTPGSAAAPTAALHFTKEVLELLRGEGVEIATVTLSVGIDTFRPVESEDLDQHSMHGEVCEVSEETAEAVAQCRGRIVAVGTTTTRTLETFAEAPRRLAIGRRTSKLFIRPGYDWKIVDGMFTNFHLPKTTMLMMLSALVGREQLLDAYAEAVQEEYRFLSFGDSMLVL
ncbi:tRNA preQ1(34) S-adenosylmethionine ribosyltransferase-isomerase QueA [bacterium]|nr:MAG: tRNA preQ1(34) S-adenosylmethionine ribosyltransferase-isomerase QueA [bacterium]